jgi:hypothetical protein
MMSSIRLEMEIFSHAMHMSVKWHNFFSVRAQLKYKA